MADVMLPQESLAEWKQALAAAEAGLGIAPWMTQQQCVDYAQQQIAKTEAIIAQYGNRWPTDES